MGKPVSWLMKKCTARDISIYREFLAKEPHPLERIEFAIATAAANIINFAFGQKGAPAKVTGQMLVPDPWGVQEAREMEQIARSLDKKPE